MGPEAVETTVQLGLSPPDRFIRNMSGSVIQRMGAPGFRELKRLLPNRTPAVRAAILQTFDTKEMRKEAGTLAADAALLLAESDPQLRELGAWILVTIKLRASGDDEWAFHHWKHQSTSYQALKAQLAHARQQGWHRTRGEAPTLLEQARQSFADRAEEACAITLAALNDEDILIREAALWSLAMACEHVPSERKDAIERALVLSGMSAEDPDAHELLSDALSRLAD